MSANLAQALKELASFTDVKLAGLDDIAKAHSDWIASSIAGLRAAQAPPNEGAGVQVEQQVRAGEGRSGESWPAAQALQC